MINAGRRSFAHRLKDFLEQVGTMRLCETACFEVSLDGAPPYKFQWRKDGVSIPAASLYRQPHRRPAHCHQQRLELKIVTRLVEGSGGAGPAHFMV